MNILKKFMSLFDLKKNHDDTKLQSDDADYGDRVSPPSTLLGRTGDDKSINPKDSSNIGSPYNSFKKDRF